MLGINNSGNQSVAEAIATWLLLFVINVLVMLPRGVLPELVEIYDAVIESASIAFIIYALNKGIEWRKNSKKPEG